MRARLAPGERLVIWMASKSPRGTKTARTDIELIQDRLNAAREDHRQRLEKEAK